MTARRRRAVAGLLVLAAVLVIAYWAVWYGHRSWVASSTERSYQDFENAFPVADAWLALTCLLAARALSSYRPSALLWLLCAGSAGVYLAGMDVLYDVEHGIWWHGTGGSVELAINVVTLLGSGCTLVLAWRNRSELLASAPPD